MNYIAYTIGPIHETILSSLNDDNKTKRLQAGSSYFSHFMKTLLKNIKNDFDILVPYIDAEVLTKEHKMGLFHDRFIASSNKTKDEIQDIFSSKLELTFKSIASEIESELITNELIQNMNNHSIIASENELKNIDVNIIFALNKILDSKELQRNFSYDIERNFIHTYQEKHIRSSKVKTIEAISKDVGFNYYAVITADGDKMGKKIEKEATDDVNNIKDISKRLYEFFTDDDDIYQITNTQFGGELIYAGGDDILAFLPVKYGDSTFLTYIEALNKRFENTVGKDVSLSFGVNISYYKFPLRDAIKNAFELLHQAKENASNSIAINVTKNSGQCFNTTMSLDQRGIYNAYKTLVDGVLEKTITLPHSLHHSLKRYEEAILATFKDNRTIDAMFKTVFNDNKKVGDAKGLEAVKEYLNNYKPKTNKEFDDIFSALSLVKFLREDRK